MAREEKSSKSKRSILRKTVFAAGVFIVLIVIAGVGRIVFNNVSFFNDADFGNRVDIAIASSEKWVDDHRADILRWKNIGLLKMLSECNELKANPVFEEITNNFMRERVRPACWKRLIDPSWPVDKQELNHAIESENIDNKWVLYAIAPDKAAVTPEQLHLFEPERWNRRQLSHQLDALVALRKTEGPTEELDGLIEHLCDRVGGELFFDILKIDIGQIAFVLRAGLPEKIRRRWIERIIATQLPDGGWNNKWFNFVWGRRSMFDFSMPKGNQHDTILALTVLYLVKYQYPEQFGLN